MALFMDRHYFGESSTWEDINLAHEKDLALQDQFGVKMLTYWYDESHHMGFCLGETETKEGLIRLHQQAHGSIPNQVIEVEPGLVHAFLGDLPDVDGPSASASDAVSGTRTIMFTDLVGSTDLTTKLGDVAAMEVLHIHDSIVKHAVVSRNGRLVKHTGDGMMASFTLAESAVMAAADVQEALSRHRETTGDNLLHVRIGLASGEPVEEHGDLFGTSVQLAARLCSLAEPDCVLVAEAVYMAPGSHQQRLVSRGAFSPKGFETPVLAFGLAGEGAAL